MCLALPLVGDTLQGRAWTYLPLPVETGLPVHTHAGFCLTNNRRDFWRNSPGLDAEHESWAKWNDYILQSVMPELYARSIEWLMSDPPEDFDHDVFRLWPDMGEHQGGVLRELFALENLSDGRVIGHGCCCRAIVQAHCQVRLGPPPRSAC